MMAGAKLWDFHIYALYLLPAGLSPESNLTVSRFSNITGGILPNRYLGRQSNVGLGRDGWSEVCLCKNFVGRLVRKRGGMEGSVSFSRFY